MGKRVVIFTGPRPAYGFCPVPPLTDSAPERNLYRLTEQNFGGDLDLTVISACSQTQLKILAEMDTSGKYRWVAFPDRSLAISQSRWLQNWPVTGFSRRVLGTPDIFTLRYLSRAARMIGEIEPDLLLINSLPQYIPYLKKRFPHARLGLFSRGPMGESRRHLPGLHLIITNSGGMTAYIRRLLNGAPVPVYQIPNTLDDTFCDRPKNFTGSKRIIFAGRMDPVKGAWELLQAFEQVYAALPQTRLMMVGGNFGEHPLSNYEHRLAIYASERKLPVEFFGQVTNEKMPRYYQKADLAVFPSIWMESFGMVALEAMRCGLPVVASRRPGFEELIVEGETGLIVDDPEDISGLAGAILKVINDPVLCQRMGAAGFHRSMAYTPRTAADQFFKILAEVL